MRKLTIITAICILVLSAVYFQCRSSKPADPRGDAYAGPASCANCHRDLYNSYLHTAHYVASVPASLNTIHGSFVKNLNVFNVDGHQKVVMEKSGSGLYQIHYVNGKLKESRRMDIVFGGIKGESYLYWKGDELYQLPVSYYTRQNKWLISPGFAAGSVSYSRAIGTRCLECHASYIRNQPPEMQQLKKAEQFDRNTLIYSVDCERCHGPGARHAAFHTENPGVKTARFITSYSSLPRARKLEMCGVCHSGKPADMLRSTFGFKPGDTLSKFKMLEYADGQLDTAHLDVHGNQLQLLESSKCFISSKMDCATCHDTHQNTRGNNVLYIQKCLGCHSIANHNYCKMATNINAGFIGANCIKCHMPALSSKVILAKTNNKDISTDILVHTHHIAVYPLEVKKILASLK